jgi:hydrogenase expression/formation protein HypC
LDVTEMCIAYPGIVVEVDSLGATVETDGRRRRVSTLLVPDVAIGDWVAVAVGTIIKRLDPDEAADVQRIIRAAIESTPDPTYEGAPGVQSN